MSTIRTKMVQLVESIQQQICHELSLSNEQKCWNNPWKAGQTGKSIAGGGTACIFSQGKWLEKGGVNFSAVHGEVFPDMLSMLKVSPEVSTKDLRYFATGVSIVLHPRSPLIPTVHANYRYFEVENADGLVSWFFGGGSDLSPYYIDQEGFTYFHHTLKQACDQVDPTIYPQQKKDCDGYFYLPHRKEHRGIGGIFCLKIQDRPPDELFAWARYCGNAFLPSYLPLVKSRQHLPYYDRQKHWQLIRRGRYVEFNLMYDLGTHFGFKSGGYSENILMSLPPEVKWDYGYEPETGSPEEELLNLLKSPREWV